MLSLETWDIKLDENFDVEDYLYGEVDEKKVLVLYPITDDEGIERWTVIAYEIGDLDNVLVLNPPCTDKYTAYCALDNIIKAMRLVYWYGDDFIKKLCEADRRLK